MKSFIKLFSSIKLSVFLLIIITLTTIVGTFIPQGLSKEMMTHRYGNWAPILSKLGFTHLYQSPWYLALLILFSINTITCSLSRIKPKFHKTFKPKIFIQEKKFYAMSVRKFFDSSQSVSQTQKSLKNILKSRGYKVKVNSQEEITYLLSRKRFFGLFGSDIVHLGILIIIMAGLISSTAGFRNHLPLLIEETKPVPGTDLSLKLNQFETLYYQDQSVKDWKSTITLIKDNQSILTETIEVNHPLSYKGILFYQTGYGWDWRNPWVELLIQKKTGTPFTDSIKLKVGDKISLDDKNIEINAMVFVPDFVLTEENKVTTRSLEPNNPAVYVRALEKEKIIFSGWLFLKYPEFSSSHSQKYPDIMIEFKDLRADQYSVIEVAKDPGAFFIWIGSFFVMIGLIAAFYFIPKEIRFMIKEENNHTKIYAGGTVTKAKKAFIQEFNEILESFKKSQ
jgi:cytochrome c biogenesis protein